MWELWTYWTMGFKLVKQHTAGKYRMTNPLSMWTTRQLYNSKDYDTAYHLKLLHRDFAQMFRWKNIFKSSFTRCSANSVGHRNTGSTRSTFWTVGSGTDPEIEKDRKIEKNGSSAQFWIEDRSERASNFWGDTEGPLFSRIWQRTTISLATGWGNPENGQITSIDRREERKTVSHSFSLSVF